jgi:hypothetical protein
MLLSLNISRLGPRRLRRTIATAERAGNGQRTVKARIRIDNSDESGGESGKTWHDAAGPSAAMALPGGGRTDLRENPGFRRVRNLLS